VVAVRKLLTILHARKAQPLSSTKGKKMENKKSDGYYKFLVAFKGIDKMAIYNASVKAGCMSITEYIEKLVKADIDGKVDA
jgi:hypothetical protein